MNRPFSSHFRSETVINLHTQYTVQVASYTVPACNGNSPGRSAYSGLLMVQVMSVMAVAVGQNGFMLVSGVRVFVNAWFCLVSSRPVSGVLLFQQAKGHARALCVWARPRCVPFESKDRAWKALQRCF